MVYALTPIVAGCRATRKAGIAIAKGLWIAFLKKNYWKKFHTRPNRNVKSL